MRLTSPRAHRIIAKRAANHRALPVDAINTVRVAGRFASSIPAFPPVSVFLKGFDSLQLH
jgi:hypothetical protein